MELAQILPTVNATLNGSSGVLVAVGFWAIRSGRRDLHRKLMLAAVGMSALFLVSYLARVSLTGVHRYPGTGASKAIYLLILGTHTVLAALVVPLVIRALQLALFQQRFDAHRRIARWTLPIWLYVSTTGVVVYLMLYRFA